MIRSPVKKPGFGFLACLDGSEKSEKSIDLIAKFANPKLDQVYVCTVAEAFDTNNQKAKKIEEDYNRKIKAYPEVKNKKLVHFQANLFTLLV